MNLRHDIVSYRARWLCQRLKQVVYVGILLGFQKFIIRVLLLLVIAKVEDISLLSAASN